MKKMCHCLLFLSLTMATVFAQEAKPPVHIAVVSLAHVHAMTWIPRMFGRTDLQLVGIVETNREVAARYQVKFKLSPDLFYTSLDELQAKTNVQAVFSFAATADHLGVVKECAARHLDVMVEKPMALNADEARAMEAAAKNAGIHLVVNYETTWYSANQEAYALIHDPKNIGELRKAVIRDGIRGPKEIQCPPEFLEWETDSHGGGALMDFACYGANVMTWLMDGERPESVVAIAQHLKPEIYPKVEDEATVLLIYPKAQAILQATWNGPFDRKDMELYGQTGYLVAPHGGDVLRMRKASGAEAPVSVPPLSAPNTDPLSYLVAVARGMEPTDRSSAKLNVTVMEILDAARESVRTGRRIDLPPASATP
jgi:predicted dehydrogenase